MIDNLILNQSEARQVVMQATELGLCTADQLFSLCKAKNWSTKNELINGLNELFVKGVYFNVTEGGLVEIG